MRNIFLDTNIILDFYTNRIPFNEDATQIFKLIFEKKIIAYISALSYATIFYHLRKSIGREKTLQMLQLLKSLTLITPVNDKMIGDALISSFPDFEHAIQYHSAISFAEINEIVTRNIKDFRNSKLPVHSPKQFLNLFFPEI